MDHEITLTTLTYGGDAMGRLPDGRAVFVPFGLPNERVRIRLTEEKRGFGRGEIIEVLEPSQDRIAPRCKHFTLCGGCHYQNLPYERQLKGKTDILREQMIRIGKIEDPPIQPMVPSATEWNYRNHMQFHLTQDGKIGFVNSKGRAVVPISECHLPEMGINALWPELQFESNTDIDRLSIRSGPDDDLMLILESENPDPPEIEIEADVSVVHLYSEHPVVIAGREHLFINVLQKDFRVSAASFFQVNTKMAEKMVEHLLLKFPVDSTSVLLDVYCGVGLFSKFLAPKCGRVIGIESSESACEDFAFNLDEFDHVELYEGLAEEILPGFVGKIENISCMLVDPPRAGIEQFALDAMIELNSQMIAYVSCDPSTLARDTARFIKAGYQLVEVTPFDLFPQTYHIESISIFEKK
jgi:23S rRNA (uracil1939-C5)-methyltransferase